MDGLSNVEGGFKSLADTVDSVANQIVSALLKIAVQKGLQMLLGAIGGGESALAGSDLLSSPLPGYGMHLAGTSAGLLNLSGARRKGGPVIGGKNYLVGEAGEEIFTAPHSGEIIANDNLTGGSRMKFEQHLHVDAAVDLATRSEVYRLAGATKDAAVAAIRDADRRRG